MRGYLLKICGVFIISAVCEIVLPDGNIKKYSKVLMSIVVCITLLSPFEFGKLDLSVQQHDIISEDTFEESIYDEYKIRLETMISEKCSEDCEVFLDDDKKITKILAEGEISEEGKQFITEKLGLSEEIIYEKGRE